MANNLLTSSVDQQSLIADVSIVNLLSEETVEGLTLETSAIHQTSRAKNVLHQPLLVKTHLV